MYSKHTRQLFLPDCSLVSEKQFTVSVHVVIVVSACTTAGYIDTVSVPTILWHFPFKNKWSGKKTSFPLRYFQQQFLTVYNLYFLELGPQSFTNYQSYLLFNGNLIEKSVKFKRLFSQCKFKLSQFLKLNPDLKSSTLLAYSTQCTEKIQSTF